MPYKYCDWTGKSRHFSITDIYQRIIQAVVPGTLAHLNQIKTSQNYNSLYPIHHHLKIRRIYIYSCVVLTINLSGNDVTQYWWRYIGMQIFNCCFQVKRVGFCETCRSSQLNILNSRDATSLFTLLIMLRNVIETLVSAWTKNKNSNEYYRARDYLCTINI